MKKQCQSVQITVGMSKTNFLSKQTSTGSV